MNEGLRELIATLNSRGDDANRAIHLAAEPLVGAGVPFWSKRHFMVSKEEGKAYLGYDKSGDAGWGFVVKSRPMALPRIIPLLSCSREVRIRAAAALPAFLREYVQNLRSIVAGLPDEPQGDSRKGVTR